MSLFSCNSLVLENTVIFPKLFTLICNGIIIAIFR